MHELSTTAPSLGAGEAVLAFDVGGTDIKSAIVDHEGRVLGLARTATPRNGDRTVEAIVNRLAELASELTAAHPNLSPVAGGLVVPGIVDSERGLAVYSSNLGWRNAPLRDAAESALGLPVALHHDVTAASLAEYRLGAAGDFDDVVVLVVGTGIAGSVILGGKPHVAGGFAGEFGHSPVAETPVCLCGARGCLEAIASAGAIARRYIESGGDPVTGAREVLARAESGDVRAQDVWNTALDALAFSVAQIAATIAPEAIVIGGGLSKAGEQLFAPLRSRFEARLSFQRRPALIAAELGGDAGLLGSALVARDRAHT